VDYAGKAKAFLNGESGATSIDYGLIVAGISATIIAAVKGIGTTRNIEFPSVSSHLGCPSDTWCSWPLWPAHFSPSLPWSMPRRDLAGVMYQRATHSTANWNTGSNALCGTVTARPLVGVETGQLLMAQFSRP
jgi:pilus assembly protein Flp/PilA